jgi:hypothetical protein
VKVFLGRHDERRPFACHVRGRDCGCVLFGRQFGRDGHATRTAGSCLAGPSTRTGTGLDRGEAGSPIATVGGHHHRPSVPDEPATGTFLFLLFVGSGPGWANDRGTW